MANFSSASKKRKIEELDVSEIDCSSEAATVHGIVTELSPVKISKKNTRVKYFTGKLSDGKKTIRVISFNASLRDSLENSRSTNSAVRVVNCQIQNESTVGRTGFEILASNRTKVELSPEKNFQIA